MPLLPSKQKKQLQKLTTQAKGAPGSAWVVRRFGYSPQENPNKLALIMDATTGQVRGQLMMRAFVPSLVEIVDAMHQAVVNGAAFAGPGYVPEMVMVDYEPLVEPLKRLLASAALSCMVMYYPPPSSEEQGMYPL